MHRHNTPSRHISLGLGGLALGIAALDLTSKQVAVNQLAVPAHLPLGVDLELTYNSGLAFGVLSNFPPGAVLALVVSVAVVLALAVVRGSSQASPVALALILGGAIANLIDRAGDGRVTDFIDPGDWPAFNLADVAITAGAVLLVASLLRTPGAGSIGACR